MNNIRAAVIRIAMFALVFLSWMWVLAQPLAPIVNLGIIVGAVLLVFPVVWLGRLLLDKDPSPENAAWMTTLMHALVMVLFGAAFIRAFSTYETWRGWVIPIPLALGLALVIITGAAAALSVLNLALRGRGAPFAIALSRRLAIDWLYAWTRNPMVLATLALLLALGLWFQSGLFVLWALLLVTPALLFFVRVFEERELEIRFGEPYLQYKASTPMLLPRRPGSPSLSRAKAKKSTRPQARKRPSSRAAKKRTRR